MTLQIVNFDVAFKPRIRNEFIDWLASFSDYMNWHYELEQLLIVPDLSIYKI